MSCWTYVSGMIVVSPMGRTQAEKRYILETVLDHLPLVTGSEGNMDVYIIQKNGHDESSSHTEFGMWGGYRNWKTLSTDIQSKYILVVDGNLRDRMFDQTFREFQKWLCRLAKRAWVEDVMVEVKAYEEVSLIRNTNDIYTKMFEDPTWCNDDEYSEPNWCEYLMWDRARKYDYPMMLAYKYIDDPENDQEVERRIDYMRKE